jgi:hypothetical protein
MMIWKTKVHPRIELRVFEEQKRRKQKRKRKRDGSESGEKKHMSGLRQVVFVLTKSKRNQCDRRGELAGQFPAHR